MENVRSNPLIKRAFAAAVATLFIGTLAAGAVAGSDKSLAGGNGGNKPRTPATSTR
jgi:hypothetical protein